MAIVVAVSVCLPWLAAIGWLWPKLPRDGAVTPSYGELLRRRH
jgi:hypothetical protein